MLYEMTVSHGTDRVALYEMTNYMGLTVLYERTVSRGTDRVIYDDRVIWD